MHRLGSLVILAACSSGTGATQIEVTEHNELGITALETARGGGTFTLRALAADGQEIAFVSERIGIVDDLPELLPGDTTGTEIVVSVLGSEVRMVTHETERFRIQPIDGERATADFFALDAVARVLASDAHIEVPTPAATSQTGETPYYAESCHGNVLLTSPSVRDCCHSFFLSNPFWQNTLFVRPSDQKVISRDGIGSTCKASDGVSACSGAACYYGPFGFARPVVYSYGSNPYIKKYPYSESNTYCYGTSGPGPSQYPSLGAGTNPTGQGCPGGGTGAYQWDY